MTGLSTEEAKKRILQYGPNTLAKKKRFFLLIEFITSFFSPLIIVLLAAGIIAAAFGQIRDFAVILGIILLSGIVTFVQHFRAQHAAEKLKQKVQLTATVIRDNITREIPFSDVTVGDLVVLSAGDIVPADCEFIEGRDLLIDESLLTGESFPVEKSEKKKELFLGTHVQTGEATAKVVNIGQQTRFGKLSKELLTAKPATSFDKSIDSFSRLVVQAVLIMTVFVFLINAILHHGILESLLFALSLAVGLTPELLPVILTINLSRGAMRMEQKDVVVKFLPSIQNFGAMNVLCADKTGTLTENIITLNSYVNIKNNQDNDVLMYGLLTGKFQSGYKNPLDKAVLKHAQNISLQNYKKIDELPFDFERKALSIIVEKKDDKKRLLVLKGAGFSVINKLKHTDKGKQEIKSLFEKLSSQGLRVIIVAIKEIEKKPEYSFKDENDLHFVGFLTFSDPVKHTVKPTIRELENAGISIKILTGDNEFVTKTVCKEVGIPVDEVVLGHELEKMGTQELFEKTKNATIFARLNPQQKELVVTTLRKQGNVVGFIGDGINDAPPLKASDIGISVNTGSDIAKDTADVILMKYSLHVLLQGVIEGRKTYANILKYIMMEISSNMGNMITIAISSIFLPFLPLLPSQILLNNFLYDFSQLTLASDNVDSNFVIKPQKWDIKFIRTFMAAFSPISSLFDFVTFFVLLYVLHVATGVFRTGWFLESLISQVLIIFAIRTRKLPFFKSKPSILLVVTSLLVILVGVFLTQTNLGQEFSFVRLPAGFFVLLVFIIVAYFVMVETVKYFFYKLQKNV